MIGAAAPVAAATAAAVPSVSGPFVGSGVSSAVSFHATVYGGAAPVAAHRSGAETAVAAPSVVVPSVDWLRSTAVAAPPLPLAGVVPSLRGGVVVGDSCHAACVAAPPPSSVADAHPNPADDDPMGEPHNNGAVDDMVDDVAERVLACRVVEPAPASEPAWGPKMLTLHFQLLSGKTVVLRDLLHSDSIPHVKHRLAVSPPHAALCVAVDDGASSLVRVVVAGAYVREQHSAGGGGESGGGGGSTPTCHHLQRPRDGRR